ncbi:cytochrome P450 [Mycena vulgaris]|nr:cytochrome P450 [Mycena vulgaris]
MVWAAGVGGRALRRALHTTAMPGPPRSPESRAHSEALDVTKLYRQYGPVFQVPTGSFSNKLVLCDAAAIAHFYANAPTIYLATKLVRESTKNLVGRGLIWVDGDQHHYGHRQALSPMFSDAVVDSTYSPVFFAMANTVQKMWSEVLDSRPRGIVVDIQHCLDSLGVAGFSHDFESLSGDHCIVTAAFHALRSHGTNSASDMIFRLASTWPILRNVPTAKNRIIQDFQACISRIATDVLERNVGKGGTDSSVLGLLSMCYESPLYPLLNLFQSNLSQKILPANFDSRILKLWLRCSATPLINSLEKWLLVELGKHPEIQGKLRTELQDVTGDLTHSKIAKLPYLHAVVYESLRLHPPMGDTTRVVIEDDAIPLSSPILARSGEPVTSIKVAKGTVITAPIRYVNTSEIFWGPGSFDFKPERYWQDKSNTDFPGNRHLAFGDGPRTCLGANFSLSLLKVVLSVIVKSFVLSLPEGPQTIVESTSGHVTSPRMSGQGSELRMVVRRL